MRVPVTGRVGDKDDGPDAEQARLCAEEPGAIALLRLERIVGNALRDQDYYERQAEMARRQAAQIRFREIRDRLLNVAALYDALANRAEHAVRTGRWRLSRGFEPASSYRRG